MDVKTAYNSWAGQYDTNENKTRDLEAIALRETLAGIPFSHCLEIGCGTGKNTEWLCSSDRKVTAVDFSEEMLAKARARISSGRVEFLQADIDQPWLFAEGRTFDLVSFSLVLEHIENIDAVFARVHSALNEGGYVYIGELHPFKQYTGSKARFETNEGVNIVTCFDHHVSDFTGAAKKHGFGIVRIEEYFDGGERSGIPRILVLLLRKEK